MQMKLDSDQNYPWGEYTNKISGPEIQVPKINHKVKKMKLHNNLKDIAKIIISFEDFSQTNCSSNDKLNFNKFDLGIEIKEMLKKEVLHLNHK